MFQRLSKRRLLDSHLFSRFWRLWAGEGEAETVASRPKRMVEVMVENCMMVIYGQLKYDMKVYAERKILEMLDDVERC